MTERGDLYNTSFRGAEVSTLALASAASTGTKTGTCSSALDYTSVSFVVPPFTPAPIFSSFARPRAANF
jgi:hypothetical protein